jgi:hypothetical protein
MDQSIPKPNALFARRAESEREVVNEENALLWSSEMNDPSHMGRETDAPTRLAAGSEIQHLHGCPWLPNLKDERAAGAANYSRQTPRRVLIFE